MVNMELPPSARTASSRLTAVLLAEIYEYAQVTSFAHFRRCSSLCHGGLELRLKRDASILQEWTSLLSGLVGGADRRVWVGVRARPQDSDGSMEIMKRRITVQGNEFFFNEVFDGAATQAQVWRAVQPSLMRCMLRREHTCLMAYGQTGSGKTHTMFGNPGDVGQEGLAFRAVRGLSRLLKDQMAAGGLAPEIEFSFLEVYNEQVNDLLGAQQKCPLASRGGCVEPQGLTRHPCSLDSLEEQVVRWINEGAESRIVGRTVFNPQSSRSHAVATLHIHWEPRREAVQGSEGAGAQDERGRPCGRRGSPSGPRSRSPARSPARSSASPRGANLEDSGAMNSTTRLYLVDLAGSERAGQYALSAQQLKEGANINKSLSVLGRVVGALSRGKGEHVPVRDSTLTWLLSDAITGQTARTFMVAAVQPAHTAETLSTLRYAHEYSCMGSNDLDARIHRLAEEVRELRHRQLPIMMSHLDELLFKVNFQGRVVVKWSRQALNSRAVRLSKEAQAHFEGHPFLRWTDAHQGKMTMGVLGYVRRVVSGAPPVPTGEDPEDGRVRLQPTDAAAPRVSLEVVFENRSGRTETVLWCPDAAVNTVDPPRDLRAAARRLSEGEQSLLQKEALLSNLRLQLEEQHRRWMESD